MPISDTLEISGLSVRSAGACVGGWGDRDGTRVRASRRLHALSALLDGAMGVLRIDPGFVRFADFHIASGQRRFSRGFCCCWCR